MTNDVWFKASEINEVIEVGSRRLRAILNDMVLDGILEVDGQTKGKKYRIKDKEISKLEDRSEQNEE